MKNGILSKSEARILAEALGNHLIEENAMCIHFPHPSHMVKVELLPLPTRGEPSTIFYADGFDYLTVMAADIQKDAMHVSFAKKRRRK